QAEDGIRDSSVTGVQTCALPISIDAKKLDAGSVINAEALVKSGALRRAKDGVRLLGRGEITAKVNIEVHGASKSAIAAVEKAGRSEERRVGKGGRSGGSGAEDER